MRNNFQKIRENVLLPATSGILLALCFPPFNIYPFVFIALVPLIISLNFSYITKTPLEKSSLKSIIKNSFFKGFIGGFVFFFLLMWWVAPTISTYGNLPLYLSYPVVFILTAYLGVYWGFWCITFSFIKEKNKKLLISDLALISAIWVILEWIRSFLLTGLPWGLLPYCLDKIPILIQTADIWGVYGISFFIVFINILICYIFFDIDIKLNARIRYLFLIPLIFSFLIIYGHFSMKENSIPPLPTQKIIYAGSVQGNIPQDVKWDAKFQWQTLDIYARLSKEIRDKLPNEDIFLVYPETAMPFYFQENTLLRRAVESISTALNLYILTGAPYYETLPNGEKKDKNSAFLLHPDGTLAGQYDKFHLVPFGEYMPLDFMLSWLRNYLPTAGDFVPGKEIKPIGSDPLRVGVLICFESIFPEIARKMVKNDANILAVITNDAWFGRTGAPYQHEQFSVFRAVETRKWVIRAANTGVSSIISPTGIRKGQTQLFKEDFVISRVELNNKKTPWILYGNWILSMLCGIIFVFFIINHKRRSQ